MRFPTWLLRCVLVIAAGCSDNSPSAGAPDSPTPDPTGDAGRSIAEADIIQLDGGLLYAMSKSGTLSVVDVSQPGRLALLGQTRLCGTPFEMYLRGGFLIALCNVSNVPQNAFIQAVDVRDPRRPIPLPAKGVVGELADSRIVGSMLYLASYQNVPCYGCASPPRTLVTSLAIGDPAAIQQIDQVSFQSNAPDGYNLPWGINWKRSIFVTPTRLYIGGHADIDPNDLYRGTANEGIIDVLDISDPSGRLTPGARLSVAGAILSRWQLDERDGILRVISQKGAGRTGNGLASPEIETFRVGSTQAIVPLGRASLTLPRQEGLRTVRFDQNRAYAITYNQTDPLFVIDLTDAAHPMQLGELMMPGFMFYLEPHGDRVIGLGIDRSDPGGSLNVSLFDVSDGRRPRLISRVPFATPYISEDYAILDGELPEDQDRIQKAFRVLSDGLVVVPFSALRSRYDQGTGCDNTGGGVQLVEWSSDRLASRGLLPIPGNPRRAFEYQGEMIAVSESNVRAFALPASSDGGRQLADVVIGTCTPKNSLYGAGYGYGYGEDGYRAYACAAAPGGAAAPPLALLIVLALLARRKKTSS